MTATPGPVTIACPLCRESFTVPTTVLHVDETHQRVLVSMDRTELYGHLAACAAGKRDAERHELAEQERAEAREDAMGRQPAGTDLAKPTPAGTVPVMWPAYVAKGSRPCTMCGAQAPACLESLADSVPCCGACGEGNTHPARHESVPCREYPSLLGAAH